MPRPEEDDVGVLGLLVQLAEETRADVKQVRQHDLPALGERVTRLEIAVGATPGAQAQAVAGGMRSWGLPAKATVGVTGVVTIALALIQVLQSLGALPPPPPTQAAPPPPALTAGP